MSSKKQVFDNSTPIKTGHQQHRNHHTKAQIKCHKNSLEDLSNEIQNESEKVAQVPVSHQADLQQPLVPTSSPEQSINDSLNDDLANEQYPLYQEINVNTTGVYDCGAVPVQIGSPYYVYQSPYSQPPDYQMMNTPQQNCNLYQAYVYDPNLGAYTLNTYSPMQQQQVSSPQQSSLLGSYQTPRQPQNLYNMAQPCMSPMESSVPTTAESNGNSPCQYQYVMYPPPPQNAYLSPMAPQTYMMYQPPPQQTPTSIPSEQKFKPRKYNNHHNNNRNKKQMTSVESTPTFPTCAPPSQNLYQSNSASPVMDQQVESEQSQFCPAENMYPSPVSMCSPQLGENPYAFCDQNGMFNLQGYYDYVNGGIQSFGDEEEEENLEEENEQLACYTCRGRRMCFCYFLKVRYYKFPSFLDLVDHQYKKWRQNMIKAKKSN